MICCRDILITNIGSDITIDGLCAEMRDICKFADDQPFTVKWVDEEGTSCICFVFKLYSIFYFAKFLR